MTLEDAIAEHRRHHPDAYLGDTGRPIYDLGNGLAAVPGARLSIHLIREQADYAQLAEARRLRARLEELEGVHLRLMDEVA